jgi:predicted PilT family ATPase
MANRTTQQLHAAATATKRLFQRGIYGPKVEEIAEEAHGGLWPIGPEEIDWIKKHISQIKSILEEDDLAVTLVNKDYYGKYRRRVPATIEAAMIVMPKRGSFSAAGIHLSVSEDDTIFLASQQRTGDIGVGSIRKVSKNLDRAIKQNLITRKNGQQFIRAIKHKVSHDEHGAE